MGKYKEKTGKKAVYWQRTQVQNLLRDSQSGRYYGRWTVAGKQIWVALETNDLDVAKFELRKHEKVIQAMRASKHTGAGQKGFTMGGIIAIYKARVEAMDCAESTKKQRRRGVAKVLQLWPGFEVLVPKAISPADVEAFAVRLKTTNHALKAKGVLTTATHGNSSSTVNLVIDTLRYLFNIAKEKGLIHSNPVEDQPDTVRLKKKVAKGKVVIPSNKDVAAVIDYMAAYKASRGHGAHAAHFCRFMMFSGARLGEGAKSLWSHIDWVGNRMWIAGYKTESSARWIPLFPDLAELLKEVRAERERDALLGLRGPLKEDEHIWVNKSCRRSLDTACAALGIRRITHHGFRHVFVTASIEAGVDFLTISKWVGHSTPRLVMETYGHLREEHSQTWARNLRFGQASMPAVRNRPLVSAEREDGSASIAFALGLPIDAKPDDILRAVSAKLGISYDSGTPAQVAQAPASGVADPAKATTATTAFDDPNVSSSVVAKAIVDGVVKEHTVPHFLRANAIRKAAYKLGHVVTARQLADGSFVCFLSHRAPRKMPGAVAGVTPPADGSVTTVQPTGT